jgi:diguanylate cyclase (GGDEF)-like protein
MSEAQPQPAGVPATLDLEDAARLAGELSALPDGRLQLARARLVRNPASGNRPTLRAGAIVTLALSPTDSLGHWSGTNPVAVKAISGDTITLEFAEPENEATQRCRDFLAGVLSAPGGPHVSTEYAPIFKTLRDRSLEHLNQRLTLFFADLANWLFDLSTQVKHSSSDQNIYYDATIAVRRNNAKITAAILEQLSQLYLNLTPDKKQDDYPGATEVDDASDLNLVDTTEFESSLAMDRMITLGEETYQVSLEALQIRLATLIDADPIEVRLPVHVRPLCRSFQRVVTAQRYPSAVLLRIFEFFTRDFMRDLGNYYGPLNLYLSETGILPDLEEQIQVKGTLLQQARPARPVIRQEPASQPKPEPEPKPKPKPKPEQHHDASAAGEPPPPSNGKGEEQTPGGDTGSTLAEIAQNLSPQAAAGAATPAPQQTKYDNIYKSVIDALNFRRAADGQAAPDHHDGQTPLVGTWEGATVAGADLDQQNLADATDIARVLGGLQQSEDVRSAVKNSSSLREYLANNKQQLGDLKDTAGLTAESLNQLDLVDNLFGTIKSQLDVTSELKPSLGNLHIPLAKLALLDQHFFLDRDHPARATVDKLSQLATSANFPNKALESRITQIVDDIVDNYDDDSAVFDSALQKIDKLLAQQQRALSRNVERVVRIQEGQEKLHKAQQFVDQVISTHIKPPRAPKVLIDLIDNGWRDLLVLTHIKEGAQSSNWHEHIRTLDQLGLWLSEQEQGAIDEDMMLQRGLEAGTLIDMIGQQIASALPTNVSHQSVLDDLRDTLAGNRNVEFTAISEDAAGAQPVAAEVRAKIEDLPRLRRWVMRVEQLEKDTWLSYRGKDGQRRRMQLAWISDEKDRYIFVNERGQKVADLSAIQLARQLSQGMQPPAPADQLSVVDQSLYQTLEHVQKTLSFARNHDSLTKLINRDTFMDQLQRALRHSQQKQSQHAVLFLNIDQFSLVNEVYDRIHGDQVLLEFARLLAQLHGKKSSSARLEADSFAVLLLDRSLEQALQIAEKIRRDIELSSVEIEGEKISFTVSIGIAPIRDFSPEVSRILNDARDTMHRAKEQGRNQVLVFEEDQAAANSYIQEKNRIQRDLEKAVATERFVLRAQPIVQTEVASGATLNLHYELLLGLSNKDGTLSSPEEFIVSAERYGFMTLVDRWVVREAFSWISQLMDAQKVVPSLSINLSGTSVTDDDFMDYLFDQISEFGVGTSRICFEITETGTISNLVKAADFVRAFRNIGCKFSIDDFGTGLASHNYLRELPVDYVKIDGSFVTNIHNNRNDYAIARSINDLAHFLGQETIAESVENDEIVVKLREIGVDFLQGWGVGRPKILSEVANDLSSIEK